MMRLFIICVFCILLICITSVKCSDENDHVILEFDQQKKKPHGCAEENMVFFVTYVAAINYLKQVQPSNVLELRSYLEIGYQRELTYKHADGSFSVFGQFDRTGSTWLTAFVIRSFIQALQYIYIDPNIIESGLKFLDGKQTMSGEFREDGKPTDSLAKDDGIGLTSFVLLAFLENAEYGKQYENTIEKGLQYLEQEQSNTNC